MKSNTYVSLISLAIATNDVSNRVRMYHVSFLSSIFWVIWNTPDIFYSAAPNSVSNSVGMHPCFQNFLSSSNFQNIDSNCVRRHHLSTLVSKSSQQFQL